MTITRVVSACLLLFSSGWLSAGCAAAKPPPGSYPGPKSCTGHLQCNVVNLPPCTLNQNFCYQGKCQIKDDPACARADVAATTAPATVPAPTLSPTIEPAPAEPAPN